MRIFYFKIYRRINGSVLIASKKFDQFLLKHFFLNSNEKLMIIYYKTKSKALLPGSNKNLSFRYLILGRYLGRYKLCTFLTFTKYIFSRVLRIQI